MAVQTLTTSFDFIHITQHLDHIMNAMDYWLLAREYLIWNAAVAALQFWTADPEPHVLSSTIEQVYNTFFYTTSTHLLCQQSEEVLFGCFVTILNAAFESKLALEDKGYESGSKNVNIPLLSEDLPESTMFPSIRTFPFTLLHHAPQIPTSHATSLYATGYHSVALMMKKVLQLTFHLLTAPQNPMDSAQQLLFKSIYTICGGLEEEEDFQTVNLNDEHWITDPVPDRLLCIHEHSPPHLC